MAIRLPWQPLGMLRSILCPIITCAFGPGGGCNYLVCLSGNIEKAFIKLTQWVGICRAVSGEAERLLYSRALGKLRQHSSSNMKGRLHELAESQ